MTWIEDDLSKLEASGLYREMKVEDLFPTNSFEDAKRPRDLNFASNNYLNLAHLPDPECLEKVVAGIRRFGSGSAASRLVSGTFSIHQDLEQKLAAWLAKDSCLLVGSGYLANLGAVSSLAGRKDYIIADKYCHASLIDGAVLSRAKLYRFRHNSLDDLRKILSNISSVRATSAKVLIVTESVFSMDGDCAPLAGILELAREFDAMLLIDEAHALGVFGKQGRGLVPELGEHSASVIVTGTLSKSLASYGGFIACEKSFYRWCSNKARSFVYSTALPPASVVIAEHNLERIQAAKTLGVDLLSRAEQFRCMLSEIGIATLNSVSQIIPLLVQGNNEVMKVSRKLLEAGIRVAAIRSPTVPVGRERLRFSLTLAHEKESLEYVAETLQKIEGKD